MKKILAGGFILLSGIVLYTGTALRETGGHTANIVAIILSIIGFCILIYECYLKEYAEAYKKAVIQRNLEFKDEYETNNLTDGGSK